MKLFKSIRLCIVSVVLILSMLLCNLAIVVFAEGDSTGSDAAESEQDDGMVDVVVLVNDVAASRKIKKTDVEVKRYKDVNLPKNIISNPSKVVGKYAKRQLYAGEYVYADQLSDKSTNQSSADILNQAIAKSDKAFVNVTDYFLADTGEDVTTHIQGIIDKNPGRTIYFPDGEYIISRPIKTYGAASFTTSLWLSDGAVIKADPENWRQESTNVTAMLCLGKADRDKDANNDVVSIGSYYSLQGGTIDGSGVATTVSLGGGRETLIKNVVLKNTPCGIDIPTGTNNVSSDMDVDDVTIIGTGASGSVGINIIGYDNTFTNIRIYNMEIGIVVESGGNAFRDIHVYNTSDTLYATTKGFYENKGSNNFYYHCYIQDCAVAYNLNGNSNTIDSCTGKWTSAKGGQSLFVFEKSSSKSQVSACRAEFFGNVSHSFGASNYDVKIEKKN